MLCENGLWCKMRRFCRKMQRFRRAGCPQPAAVNLCTSLHGGMGSCRPTGRRQSRGKCRQSVHIVTRRHGVMPPYGKTSISEKMLLSCAGRSKWRHGGTPRPTGKGCSGAPEIHSARQKTHICIFTVQFCRNIYRSGKIYAILRKRTGI